MEYKNVLITGGCGFIGSNFVNYMVEKYPRTKFFNLDKLDYCATTKNNQPIQHLKNYKFVKGDILDEYLVLCLLNEHNIDAVIHFAAQSHVDNSFGNSIAFTQNNVLGTHTLLEASRIYGRLKRFIHISTDEVYGEVHEGESHEHSTLDPTNPYAASKAAAEFMVKSYHYSFKLPVIITRGNNVYGPRQYPEKVIPKFLKHLESGEKCTIHGNGKNVRNFIHVLDTAKAVEKVLLKGDIGEIYNIGGTTELSVLDVATLLVHRLKPGEPVEDWLIYVEDRKFNDTRYSVSTEKLRALDWCQTIDFEEGFEGTVQWYLDNPDHFEN
jgi:dTDP-glucose 4,6-dehydratase